MFVVYCMNTLYYNFMCIGKMKPQSKVEESNIAFTSTTG